MKKHNFSAGPCILPQSVLQQAAAAVQNFDGLDLSLIEISHRSKNFIAVVDEITALTKELLGVPAGYSVIFLGGGASLEFCMVPYNFMRQGGKAAYLETGTWAKNARIESELFGDTVIAASSADKNFSYIPKGYDIPADADYFHCTSNNTIFGTQMKSFPKTDVNMICDMSSDIFSKPVNVADFGMIYAGAQKNMGPAGVTMVIVKDELLGKTGRNIPTMLDYRTHIKGESMFNTPPVFPIYVSMLTLRWLKENGGISWIEGVNQAKADLLYGEVDRNPLFEGTAAKEDRSFMNPTFLLTQPDLAETFDKMWKDAGISGLPGHRSVGGYRASMYNAMPLESVRVLVDVMKELERNA